MARRDIAPSTRRFAAASLIALVACSAESGERDDSLSGGEPDGAAKGALVQASCAPADAALFFHGMEGYGRELIKTSVCGPNIYESGGFWSNVAFVAAPGADLVAGYSAGRLPLLRRLARGAATEKTAVMLDPSYADGRRFDGKTGPEIVSEWLTRDSARRFVLVHSPTSAGYREYVALRDTRVREQVRVCPIRGDHIDMPRLVGTGLLLDLPAWLVERCGS